MAHIAYKDISISYDKFSVLNGFTLDIKSGQIVSLFGPSGCGKSTIMKALLGLIHPLRGSIEIDGVPAVEYNNIIGYIPQDNQLLPWLTVEQNIDLWRKDSNNEEKENTKEILELVNLTEHRKKLPNELSGGMLRRTALARGLVTKTEILCLDEVLVSIERELTKELIYQIRNYVKSKNITTLVISHDFEEAVFLSDHIYVLSATPTEIIKSIEIKEKVRNIDFFDSDDFKNYSEKLIR